jgi:hypothetical protein
MRDGWAIMEIVARNVNPLHCCLLEPTIYIPSEPAKELPPDREGPLTRGERSTRRAVLRRLTRRTAAGAALPAACARLAATRPVATAPPPAVGPRVPREPSPGEEQDRKHAAGVPRQPAHCEPAHPADPLSHDDSDNRARAPAKRLHGRYAVVHEQVREVKLRECVFYEAHVHRCARSQGCSSAGDACSSRRPGPPGS